MKFNCAYCDKPVETTTTPEGFFVADKCDCHAQQNAVDELHCLWYKMKREGNCKEYVTERCAQVELLGTETNTLTKLMVKEKLQLTLNTLD